MKSLVSLEDLLETLGEAHRDGALQDCPAGRPWMKSERQAEVRPAAGLRWVRVAAPLAAAAAVAVVFVGPSLFGTRAGHEMAQDGLATIQPETPQLFADAGVVTTAPKAADCDFNGDGVIDGLDIQALVNRIQDIDGDPLLQAEELQRCLLGS